MRVMVSVLPRPILNHDEHEHHGGEKGNEDGHAGNGIPAKYGGNPKQKCSNGENDRQITGKFHDDPILPNRLPPSDCHHPASREQIEGKHGRDAPQRASQ
jgi:hypothetical protein